MDATPVAWFARPGGSRGGTLKGGGVDQAQVAAPAHRVGDAEQPGCGERRARRYGHDGSSKMPANPEKILSALVAQGKVSATAPASVKEAAVESYLKLKSKGGGPDKDYNPLARKRLTANEEALNALSPGDIRGKKLGNTVDVPASTPQFMPLEGTEKLLLIAVDFADTAYTWQPTGRP